MAWSVARGAAIGFTVVVAVLITYTIVSLQNVWRIRQVEQLVSHTDEVLLSLEGLISTIKDAETGQRGYIITGEESYLEPYQTAVAELKHRQDKLRELISDSPQQLQRLNSVNESASNKMTELDETIAMRRDGKVDEVRQRVLSGAGKSYMDKVRERIDTMETVERSLLQDRTKEAEQSYRVAIVANLLGLGLTIAALAVAWFLINRELRARIQASRQANEQKERLLTTLTSIGDAVIVADRQGRVTLMNPVAEQLTGWGREAYGQLLSNVFHIVNETTRAIVESPVDVVLKKGVIVGLANHTVLIRKDGAERPIDDSGAPIRDEEGHITGVVLVFRDVTERRDSEKIQERLNHELREADRNKDQFLATLAHELRNPLAPLSNALELWPALENNRGEMEELRKMMERQVQQMIRLIDDLLDLSRITRGKVQLRRQPVEVATLINGAVEAIGPFINRCGHQLTVNVPDHPVLVHGDVARLVQVVANILHNAAKYTGRNGKIWVTADQLDGHVNIKVRDNGPGIPPEMVSHVFDMFTQVDHTLDRSHGGLGIGLTLVKNLVELHEGTVAARSDGIGQGSEFTVRLPVLVTDPTDAQIAARQPAPLRRAALLPPRKVLVVDDVAASAKTLALMFQIIGQEVEVRYDGSSALEAVASFRPDVVFMDIGMPQMDGYEVARRLRQNPELAGLTLVALTGYGQDEDRRQALEAGFNYHLVKPTSLDTLEQLLQTVPASSA